MALVDLRPASIATSGERSGDSELAYELALRRIEQVVRDDDRVCPFGVSRVAIAFGPDAEAVAPKTLGVRLARAVRKSQTFNEQVDLRRGSIDPKDVRQRRLPGGEDSKGLGQAGRTASSTTVTVDRLLGSAALLTYPVLGNQGRTRTGKGPAPVRPPTLARQIRHRTVVRYHADGFAKYGTRHGDSGPGNRGTILVVSPSRTSSGVPGVSAVAATALAERLGFRAEATVLACEDELVLDVHGVELDLVVLVVDGEREPPNEVATWTSSAWHIAAQLTGRYDSNGIGVLAVGAGAGAGALAGCLAQGATVLLDLDQLRSELCQMGTSPGAADESWPPAGSGLRNSPPMDALVQLTASERRVLFYLTTGKSAQDIADDLVVSVTTVRSHIRSILRKLGVRSQLAAVAIANSRDFGRSPSNGSGVELPRESAASGVG
ncbi:MAG: helix-turn-helix transcriptional regulator [Acidimicrobiales bacterium]|nr:helix-turn-helix transcriptional regulator [Acidimicrobiales bacterium]